MADHKAQTAEVWELEHAVVVRVAPIIYPVLLFKLNDKLKHAVVVRVAPVISLFK